MRGAWRRASRHVLTARGTDPQGASCLATASAAPGHRASPRQWRQRPLTSSPPAGAASRTRRRSGSRTAGCGGGVCGGQGRPGARGGDWRGGGVQVCMSVSRKRERKAGGWDLGGWRPGEEGRPRCTARQPRPPTAARCRPHAGAADGTPPGVGRAGGRSPWPGWALAKLGPTHLQQHDLLAGVGLQPGREGRGVVVPRQLQLQALKQVAPGGPEGGRGQRQQACSRCGRQHAAGGAERLAAPLLSAGALARRSLPQACVGVLVQVVSQHGQVAADGLPHRGNQLDPGEHLRGVLRVLCVCVGGRRMGARVGR